MSSKFNAFIGTALQELNKTTSEHLGDRTQYVGGSDVGQCLRKAVLGKTMKPTFESKTLFRFLRGHVVQDIFAKIFAAGKATYQEEVEVEHPQKPYIKVHIDFVFTGHKRLYVVEMKSVSRIPDVAYSSHVNQLAQEMGLLRLVTPSDVAIEGCILYVDMNAGEWKVCNGYNISSPEMQALFKESERRAEKIWQAIQAGQSLEPEPSLLCGCCEYQGSCEAHLLPDVQLPADVVSVAKEYNAMVVEKIALEKRIDKFKRDIIDYTGNEFNGTADGFDVIATKVEPTAIVDQAKLKAEYPDVYDACNTQEKAGYTKLSVKKSARKPATIPKAA